MSVCSQETTGRMQTLTLKDVFNKTRLGKGASSAEHSLKTGGQVTTGTGLIWSYGGTMRVNGISRYKVD